MTYARARRVPGFRGRAAPPAVKAPPPRIPMTPLARGHVVLRWVEEAKRYVCLCGYDDRGIPKASRFYWDPGAKQWWTQSDAAASTLARYADEATLQRLAPLVPVRIDNAALLASRATDADIEIPIPAGLSLMPFQRAGVAYALPRANTLIGDQMGLGKTVQAIAVMNCMDDPFPALIVCPASLKINWRRELEKWLVHSTLPMLAGDWFPITADVVITNFERLKKHHRAIASRPWRTLIVDEAHFLKNDTTQRSKEVYGIKAERKLFLTGTPIPNRVREIWPLLSFLAPDTFADRKKFMDRYAAANTFTPLGREALNEFNVLVRSTVMVRRLKEEVLTDLPPKVRQVIEFSGEGVEAVIEKERNAARAFEEKMHGLRVAVELAKASDDPADYTAAVRELKAGVQAAFGEMSKLRHDTALVKVPFVTEHVRDVLAEGAALVLFAHHHDVIEKYRASFAKDAVVLTGENTLLERDAAVRKFQAGEAKLFIGGIQAAGVGLTLTKSSHVAFAEMDWVPGNMTQAEDRCHRIGQKDSVLVQHLVLEGSLDATMAKTLVSKQEVIEAALDAEKGELASQPMVPAMDEPATTNTTKAAIAREALRLTADDVAAIHAALKAADVTGWNKVDGAIARSLAGTRVLTAKQAALGRRVLRKYVKEETE